MSFAVQIVNLPGGKFIMAASITADGNIFHPLYFILCTISNIFGVFGCVYILMHQ